MCICIFVFFCFFKYFCVLCVFVDIFFVFFVFFCIFLFYLCLCFLFLFLFSRSHGEKRMEGPEETRKGQQKRQFEGQRRDIWWKRWRRGAEMQREREREIYIYIYICDTIALWRGQAKSMLAHFIGHILGHNPGHNLISRMKTTNSRPVDWVPHFDWDVNGAWELWVA